MKFPKSIPRVPSSAEALLGDERRLSFGNCEVWGTFR